MNTDVRVKPIVGGYPLIDSRDNLHRKISISQSRPRTYRDGKKVCMSIYSFMVRKNRHTERKKKLLMCLSAGGVRVCAFAGVNGPMRHRACDT